MSAFLHKRKFTGAKKSHVHLNKSTRLPSQVPRSLLTSSMLFRLQQCITNAPNDSYWHTENKLYRALLPYQLERPDAFACIAMFESGLYDPSPDDLQNVMALSSGDCIFASAALLADPMEVSNSEDVIMVKGNIGRAGLAFLIPPTEPLVREVSISEWPKITKDAFDGDMKNSFKNTSLHLSFTGASSRLSVGFSSSQDDDAYLLETVISVHDSGKWVADLDPLRTFLSPRFRLMSSCSDHTSHPGSWNADMQLTTIDNWLELLDKPEETSCIVRAKNNWEARMAAASLSVALGLQTLIIGNSACWTCISATMAAWHRRYNRHCIIVG